MKSTPNRRAFWSEYRECTLPTRERDWRRWKQEPSVRLLVTTFYGSVYLRRIWAVPSGTGAGTRCLRWLLALARKQGLRIIGHASKFSDRCTEGPSVMQLRRWYRAHGAKFDRHGAFTIE